LLQGWQLFNSENALGRAAQRGYHVALRRDAQKVHTAQA
jgi:hypothetical protein